MDALTCAWGHAALPLGIARGFDALDACHCGEWRSQYEDGDVCATLYRLEAHTTGIETGQNGICRRGRLRYGKLRIDTAVG